MPKNSANIKKLLDAQKTAINDNVNTKAGETQAEVANKAVETQTLVTSKAADTKSEVTAEALATKNLISAENDETQVVLAGIGESGDTNANTISVNLHTSTKADEVKAEVVRTSVGSLYKILYDALSTVINAARDSIKGGKSNLDVFNEVNTERAAITAAITSAQNVITTNTDAETTAVETVVNAARDNIKAGYNLASIFNEINTERAVVTAAISAKEVLNKIAVGHDPFYGVGASKLAQTSTTTADKVVLSATGRFKLSRLIIYTGGAAFARIKIEIDGQTITNKTSGFDNDYSAYFIGGVDGGGEDYLIESSLKVTLKGATATGNYSIHYNLVPIQ